MTIRMGRPLLGAALLLLLLLQLCIKVEARPKEAGEDGGDDDDDSSSEETVEDSGEGRKRRDANERAVIPGLPDPATIIKIAQLFQSVGEQIVPILLEAVLPVSDPSGERSLRESIKTT